MAIIIRPGGKVEEVQIKGVVLTLKDNVKEQHGIAQISTGAAVGVYSANVTFPIAFNVAPHIQVSAKSATPNVFGAPTWDNLTKNGLTIYIYQSDTTSRIITAHWGAIGA